LANSSHYKAIQELCRGANKDVLLKQASEVYTRYKSRLRLGNGDLNAGKKAQSRTSARNSKALKLSTKFGELYNEKDPNVIEFPYEETNTFLKNPDIHSEEESREKEIICRPKSYMAEFKGLAKLKKYLGSKMG
jgi:hypothetical protein